jgi:hypothetical protein
MAYWRILGILDAKNALEIFFVGENDPPDMFYPPYNARI